MFDIETEAFQRRTHPRDGGDQPSLVVPIVIGANLILWAAVLIAAI